jgi:hypothetical protein
MSSFGMLRRMALVKANVSEERSASIITVTRIGELVTTLVVTSTRIIVLLHSVRRLLVRLTLILVHRFLSP